jgi:hypothetical protein
VRWPPPANSNLHVERNLGSAVIFVWCRPQHTATTGDLDSVMLIGLRHRDEVYNEYDVLLRLGTGAASYRNILNVVQNDQTISSRLRTMILKAAWSCHLPEVGGA